MFTEPRRLHFSEHTTLYIFSIYTIYTIYTIYITLYIYSHEVIFNSYLINYIYTALFIHCFIGHATRKHGGNYVRVRHGIYTLPHPQLVLDDSHSRVL